MKAREVAKIMGVGEFTILCSYLDKKHGESARKFEVLSVIRGEDGKLKQITVMLSDGSRVILNSSALKGQYDVQSQS